MFLRRHRVLVGVVAGSLLVGAAGLAAAAPGRSGPATVAPAAAGDPEGFVGVSPVRVLDTRAGDGPIGVPAAGPLGPGQTINLALTTSAPNRLSAPVPTNAVSVLLNITIDKNASADSFVTVWPAGQPRPNSSANNATPGQVTPNSIVVPLGTGGEVSIFNFIGNVDIAVDLAGYTVPLIGTTLQGPVGPEGPRGPIGPQGPQGPAGPITGAGWVQATNPTATVNTASTPIASVGPVGVGDFVVTASFRVATPDQNTSIACQLSDGTNGSGAVIATMTVAANTISPINDGMTMTRIFEDKTAASLACTKTGAGAVTLTDATLIAVAVGDQLT